MPTPPPLDPPDSPPLAIRGRVATMNGNREIIADGVVYVVQGNIVAVGPASDAPPKGFENVKVTDTQGTIYPGLIELHNHLSYDALTLWDVPKKYGNRDQWGSPNPAYHQLISGPMQAIGVDPAVAAAVVRYVEVKCLLGGTTTSQGVRLFSDPHIVTEYRGLVRNVESTGDKALPNAVAHIPDIASKDAAKFLKTISGKQKMILHLAEGTDDAAHNHFKALEVSPGKWAITPNLIGIHCVALTDADFKVMAAHGASMVWSPFSNLLLYGDTAKVAAAAAHKVPVALGSDWSPSGSKNLLGELKVARLAGKWAGAGFSDEDLVAMTTTTPAAMLGWDKVIGTIAKDSRADLVVVAGTGTNAYTHLIDATETDISLVVIDGVPRVGTPALMAALGVAHGAETLKVGGQARTLNLAETAADPTVEAITLADATQRLRDALHNLPDSAKKPTAAATASHSKASKLAIDGLVEPGMSNRPHLPFKGKLTGPQLQPAALVAPGTLVPLGLDPLTAVDDPNFYATIKTETNLPTAIRDGLVALAP